MEDDHQLAVAISYRYSQGNMFDPLVEAVPGFRPQWEAFVVEWTGEGKLGDMPNYVLLGDLARYLLERLEADDTTEVTNSLQVCEGWIVYGDSYVKNAAIVGLLEGLQNTMLNRDISEDRIMGFLGPESLKQWKALNHFWATGEVIPDHQ